MHCAALICRSTSGVLIKPFQASFLLQPAHQEAPCAALSTINCHGFAEAAGDPDPLCGRCLEVTIILPVTYGNRGEMLSSLVPFPCTQHTVTAIFGRMSTVATSLVVLRIASPLQNSAVPADLLPGCCSTSLCWLTTSCVNLTIFLFVLILDAIQSDFHFLAALFFFMKKGTR